MIRRRMLVSLAASSPLLGRCRDAFAAVYPSAPIRLVVAFPPGGPSDVLARVTGQQLTAELNQPVVVDNRPGAGGNVAADIVARQAPTGYTLLVANNSILAANAFLYPRLSFDPLKDFTPISLIGRQPNILVVGPGLGVTSVAGLIALAKKQPGALNFASSGNGTAAHLAGEMFKRQAGIDVVHVAYPGVAPALLDLISGRVQMMFATSVAAIPFISSQTLVGLAVTTASRSTIEPGLPTIAEAGLPGFEATTWHGLVGPAHLPDAVVGVLNKATAHALQQPDVVTRLTGLGVEIAPDTPEQFAQHIRDEAKKWGDLIKSAGIGVG